ncbi:outer membrane beta-barrel protein [Acinetobacter sp.]|uniref:outer membrane beta-barrel protein n=1 Tax=Acinetobacter sp. TaxID=472 RepID=UPI003890E993
MKLSKIALVAAVLFTSQAAFAGDTYVGASVGQSRLHGVPDYGVSIDDKDLAGKIFVGKQLNRNFGIEASYFDLGDFEASNGAAHGSIGGRGLGLDLVGTVPLTQRLDVLGRVGVTRTRIEQESNFFGSGHRNVTEPKAGLGLQYKLSEKLAVRGEYEYHRTNFSDVRSHVNVASVGLVYKFGAPAKTSYVSQTTSATYVAPAPAPAPVVEAAPAPAPVAEAPVVTKKKVRE